ncbi:hypothetical protein AB0Q95_39350 [Streptomyces sp. NPDC059900]|uniref:hypothetical protein n=1 Tax=Streptomyces sp. NPDC059900 TaxID=3155816 RepID=UPI00341AB0A4
MADIYELTIALDLRDDLSGAEVAELRGHLGQDDFHGTASKAGGALTSVLLPRDAGWALTARTEAHPDDFDRFGDLLAWLAARAEGHHAAFDGSVRVGWIRFYEEDRPAPLVVRDGRVEWP